MFNNSGLLIIFLSIILLASCREQNEVISVVKDDYTVQEQTTLGRSLDNVYDEQFLYLSKDEYSDAYQYVETLYNMIVQTPSVELRDSLHWQIQLIDEPTNYRAFVSPSGTMYLSTGLLKQLVAENQLVTLMAHSVYYLESGAAFNLVKDLNDQLEVGKVVLGESSYKLNDMANTLLFSPFSDKVIKQADDFEVNLLCPFKYNATGLIDVYSNTEIQSSLEQTMPWSNERAANIALSSLGCGANDSLFVIRYEAFLEQDLPK